MNKRVWLFGVMAMPLANVASADDQIWPVPATHLEQIIWQHLQANADLGFTTIDRVKCSATTCEFAFTGPDINAKQAQYETVVISLVSKLAAQSIPVRESKSARREVSPGVNGIVVTLSSPEPAQKPGHQPASVKPEKG